MSGKRRLDLTRYFLRQSPLALYRKFTKIVTQPQSHNSSQNMFPSDRDYVKRFLDRLEATHPFLGAPSPADINNDFTFRRLFPHSQSVVKRSAVIKEKEGQLLSEAIKMVSNSSNQSLIPYQQLEQILAIATPQVINDMKNKMVYLFKLLLNRRDKLEPNGLELEANIQLTHAIIQAFSKAHEAGKLEEDWKKLEAMEKLLRAKEYKKKGLEDIATNSFQEICKDQAASSKTRFEALQVLCLDSQKIGDTSILESLMSLMGERGEKEYEDYLREHIERIKSSANGGEGNSNS